MGDAEMYIEEAIAVAKEAIEEGVARRPVDDKELEHSIRETLHASREEMKILMEQGLIPPFPS